MNGLVVAGERFSEVIKSISLCMSHQLMYKPLFRYFETDIQLFRQRLSHKSVKAYATMPIGIMGRKSLALIN